MRKLVIGAFIALMGLASLAEVISYGSFTLGKKGPVVSENLDEVVFKNKDSTLSYDLHEDHKPRGLSFDITNGVAYTFTPFISFRADDNQSVTLFNLPYIISGDFTPTTYQTWSIELSHTFGFGGDLFSKDNPKDVAEAHFNQLRTVLEKKYGKYEQFATSTIKTCQWAKETISITLGFVPSPTKDRPDLYKVFIAYQSFSMREKALQETRLYQKRREREKVNAKPNSERDALEIL